MEGNTRRKEKLCGRRDHVQGCRQESIGNEALTGTEQYSNYFLLLLSEELLQSCQEHQEKQKNKQNGGLYSSFSEALDLWLLCLLQAFRKSGYTFIC